MNSTPQDFRKTVRLGTIDTGNGRFGSVFCFIHFVDGKLLLTGVEGPLASGNCLGSSGQIQIGLTGERRREIRPAPGWDHVKFARLFQVWHTWHMNDMQSGSPDQMAFLDANPVSAERARDAGGHFDAASAMLAEAGLNPDPNYLRDGKPYKYGSAWLRKEVPESVLAFLRDLPDADKPCPRAWRPNR